MARRRGGLFSPSPSFPAGKETTTQGHKSSPTLAREYLTPSALHNSQPVDYAAATHYSVYFHTFFSWCPLHLSSLTVLTTTCCLSSLFASHVPHDKKGLFGHCVALVLTHVLLSRAAQRRMTPADAFRAASPWACSRALAAQSVLPPHHRITCVHDSTAPMAYITV